ncbi:MAG: hypothetical protein IJS45_06200 [Clostridia bacterium]|nr:hypothetical protein [Clostridia bacterium]
MEENKDQKEEIAEEKLDEVSGGGARKRTCQKCGADLTYGYYTFCKSCSDEMKSPYNDKIL